jgi:hypothetical protein
VLLELRRDLSLSFVICGPGDNAGSAEGLVGGLSWFFQPKLKKEGGRGEGRKFLKVILASEEECSYLGGKR